MTARPEIPMTPDKRAEKILDYLAYREDEHSEKIAYIAATIREAVKQERQYWQEFMKLNHFEDQSEARAEGFREGVEKAAELVRNSHGSLTAFGLADTIRELLPATEEK